MVRNEIKRSGIVTGEGIDGNLERIQPTQPIKAGSGGAEHSRQVFMGWESGSELANDSIVVSRGSIESVKSRRDTMGEAANGRPVTTEGESIAAKDFIRQRGDESNRMRGRVLMCCCAGAVSEKGIAGIHRNAESISEFRSASKSGVAACSKCAVIGRS